MSMSFVRPAALVLITLTFISAARANHVEPLWPDCFCTNRGDRVEIGDTACLSINGRAVSALCYMSQNTPGWRKIADGCTSMPVS